MIKNLNAISVGPYRVCALSRQLDDGHYAASVSIRSGHGSASTDRVMRLEGRFATEYAANHYAREQGLIWARNAGASRPHLVS